MATKKKKHNKGGQFERDISKLLSIWWTDGKRDDIFWRTKSSGGAATQRMKNKKSSHDMAGDIRAEDTLGKKLTKIAIFELKKGYTNRGRDDQEIRVLPTIDNLASVKKQPLLIEWWDKLEKERLDHRRKFSFLIFRRHRKRICIVMKWKTYNQLLNKNKLDEYSFDYIKINCKGNNLVIIRIEEFFKWCKPQSLGANRRFIKRR